MREWCTTWSMENIVISYNLPDSADVDALENVYNDLGGWKDHYTVARSYPRSARSGGPVGMGGTGHHGRGDQNRIERFYEHYVGRLGPEGAISCRGAQQSMPGG